MQKICLIYLLASVCPWGIRFHIDTIHSLIVYNHCLLFNYWKRYEERWRQKSFAGYFTIPRNPVEEYSTQNLRLIPLSANFTKWSNILKQFVGNLPTNCLSVFEHFVKLALKELRKILHEKCDDYIKSSLSPLP